MTWENETPVYAEEVNVLGRLKVSKSNNEKDAYIRLRFLDFVSKNVVADVILNLITAKQLSKILTKTIEKTEKALKSGKVSKNIIRMQTTEMTETERRYIG